MARFDKFMVDQSAPPLTNGHVENVRPEQSGSPETLRPRTSSTSAHVRKSESADVEELSEVVEAAPPKKKRKRTPVDEDAAFAAKLQAEENGRARSTRGRGPKKAAPVKKKKTPKKKTQDRVNAADDSDLDSELTEKKVNRSGGFHVGHFSAGSL